TYSGLGDVLRFVRIGERSKDVRVRTHETSSWHYVSYVRIVLCVLVQHLQTLRGFFARRAHASISSRPWPLVRCRASHVVVLVHATCNSGCAPTSGPFVLP
ncbi:unnamed protein product, partial [Scytosiphon promiscuus]